MKIQLTSMAVFLGLATQAQAQLETIASESFDYTVPGLLNNQPGGSGWFGAWAVLPTQNDIVLFDSSIMPAFASGNGGYAGQAVEFGSAFREIDIVPHADVVEGNFIGRDGSVIWISYTTVAYQVFGDHLGVIDLVQSGGDEQLRIGSPWSTYQWGINTQPTNTTTNAFISTIPGTNSANDARIVVRIDHMPGDERLQMWIDPATAHPSGGADLDLPIPDLRWNEIRLFSGGQGSHYFWEDIIIEKGEPSLGTNYCGPGAMNSAGLSGVVGASGSNVASAGDVTLTASNLPPNQFGIFVTSRTQAFVPGAGGTSNGNLCVGGSIGRYSQSNQILNAGSNGSFDLAIDTMMTPQGSGFVAIMSGDTWYFQCWYRDPVGVGSNFTDGLEIAFN